MTFITGSITDANPGPALYAVIATAALADGWTLDDTVVIGGNTHKVLKSAAAGNTYGLDWFLDINYPTTGTTGGIRFAPFEGYTAASDVGLRGPFGQTNVTTIDATTYSRYGATTSALETNWTNTASTTGVSTALTTAAFTYWVSITRNRIAVMLSNVPGAVAYTGFFTPSSAHSTHAGAAMFPLIMAVVTAGSVSAGSGSSPTAAVTRMPKGATVNWQTSVHIPSTNILLGGIVGGHVGTAVSEFTNATTIVSLPVVFGVGQTVSTSTPTAANVGALDGLGGGFVNSTAVRGDTLTVGADTWYSCTPSGSFALFMKGA